MDGVDGVYGGRHGDRDQGRGGRTAADKKTNRTVYKSRAQPKNNPETKTTDKSTPTAQTSRPSLVTMNSILRPFVVLLTLENSIALRVRNCRTVQ